MKKFFNFLSDRHTQSILGLVAINLLIWEIGPIIAVNGNYVLESITSRIVAIGQGDPAMIPVLSMETS